VITSVFQSGSTPLTKNSRRPDTSQPNPWANTPRVNVLLLGGDSGADRVGVRPDTMIVASIDTRTGNTVLFSLPRNLQHVPFPPGSPQSLDYPNGFYCYNAAERTNTECLLNSLWMWGEANKQRYYRGDPHPGLTATVEGIQELTNLRINDYVMLNLRGFRQFIDAIGGLTINVRERLPVGGSVEHPVASSYIKAGQQHLNGYYSLWYARSRWSTDDFDRMRRQRCVIGAVVQQANPVQLAIKFPQVAAAMKENLQTSIPLKELDAWVTLAVRVKKAKVLSLAFTNKVIDTSNPDIGKMRQLVQDAINPPPPKSATPSPSATKAPSKKKRSTATETGAAQDVMAVC
jgi:LCP family protein required for cell wall assembly